MKKDFLILAIDTSCDETSVAVTCDDRVLSNIVASQAELHSEYGGVYPTLAKRMHKEFLEPSIKKALSKAGVSLDEIDAVAVTVGPGLAPALEVGVARAKELARELNIPLISVNHMEGHLLSCFARNSKGRGVKNFLDEVGKPRLPLLGVLVSGGHTELVWMDGFGKYELLGETLDDAAGEAMDKVAKMLGLGYPGGPVLSEFAKKGEVKYKLPVPMRHSGDLNFSFSGLKTASLNKLRSLDFALTPGVNEDQRRALTSTGGRQFYYDFARSFEKAVVEALSFKAKMALDKRHPRAIVLGGGVIHNLRVREGIRKVAREKGIRVFVPYSEKLFSDNAAMIGVCGWYQARRGDFVKDLEALERKPGLAF